MRRIKNWLGRGFGGCLRCGDRWNWKEEQSIRFSAYSSMFPLCKECFNELSEADIIHYCAQLWGSWDRDEPFPEENLRRSINTIKRGEDDLLWYSPANEEEKKA